MRKKILFYFLIFLFSNCPKSVAAKNFTLTWDGNNETDLAGYKLYSVDSKHEIPFVRKTLGKTDIITTIVIPDEELEGGIFFGMSAFDGCLNESSYNWVSYLPGDIGPENIPYIDIIVDGWDLVYFGFYFLKDIKESDPKTKKNCDPDGDGTIGPVDHWFLCEKFNTKHKFLPP